MILLQIYRAPSGCLQYHFGTRGRLTTFNFDGSNGHLANQRYNICLKHNKGIFAFFSSQLKGKLTRFNVIHRLLLCEIPNM